MTAAASTPAGKTWSGTAPSTARRCAPGASCSIRRASAAPPSSTASCASSSRSRASHGVDVVLRQRPLALAQGHHYQLRFKAHATAPTKRARAPVEDQRALHGDVGRDGRCRRHRARRTRARSTAPPTTTASSWRSSSAAPLAGAAAADGLPRRRRARTTRSSRRPSRSAPRRRRHACASTRSATCRASRRSRPWRRRRRPPLDWQLLDARRQGARQRQDPPVRRRPLVGRARAADRLLVGHRAGRGLQAARRQRREPAVRRSARTSITRMKYDALAFFYLQRSGVPIKMPYAGSHAYERPAGHPGDKSVACAPEANCDYTPGRQRRLVRRRRPRQVRGQRRLLGLDAAERVRDAVALRQPPPATSATASMNIPEAQERPPGSARRGALRPGVHAAHAGPGGPADGRDGPPEDARRQVVRDPDRRPTRTTSSATCARSAPRRR